MPALDRETSTAVAAVRAAGEIIRGHYASGQLDTTYKADDSPLTRADVEANETILALLREQFPDDGILSEETEDDGARLSRSRVWIVDPLDGTRDFVNRTDDFAVHVGLSIDGQPCLGVVYKPVGDLLYRAVAGEAVVVSSGGVTRELGVSKRDRIEDMRIGVTRFAVNDALQRFLDDSGLAANVVRIGASIKMMALAAGEIDLSVCLNAAEKEWDTCAPEVIVRGAGGEVSDIDGGRFIYNKADVHHLRGILMTNGCLHNELVALLQPYFAS